MGGVYVLSPFGPIFIVKSVQGGGGFSSGHKWGILGGHQGPESSNQNKQINTSFCWLQKYNSRHYEYGIQWNIFIMTIIITLFTVAQAYLV